MARTQKDETDFNKQLQREEPIKTEVIVELRNRMQTLMENNARLMSSLIAAQDALRIYRVQQLEQVEQAIRMGGDCLPGCTRHYWDSADGWHRKEKE